MANPDADARLRLADKLRGSADHSSEQELRDALSRSYYSVYHAARVLVGKEKGGLTHDALQRAVERVDIKLAADLKELHRLRENADYNPDMVRRDYAGDLEQFRRAVEGALKRGRETYTQIVSMVGQQTDSSGASHGTS